MKTTPNVVSVDWESGAEPPYLQAIANARVVALEIINLIKTLKYFGVSANKIVLVGHGVGAHIAGYVGFAVKGIKKITGRAFNSNTDLDKKNLIYRFRSVRTTF